jgi:hypothetical protein
MKRLLIEIESVYGNIEMIIDDLMYPEVSKNIEQKQVDGFKSRYVLLVEGTEFRTDEYTEWASGYPKLFGEKEDFIKIINGKYPEILNKQLSQISQAIRSDSFTTIKNPTITINNKDGFNLDQLMKEIKGINNYSMV